MESLDEINRDIAEKYSGSYRVISWHGKYGLMDDDCGFNIPLIICDNLDDIKEYLETMGDNDD